MTKKLIYYFYLTDDFDTRRANRINLKCLERYAGVFDESTIFLSVDEGCGIETIKRAERVFLDMPFNGNLSFRVVRNTVYREAAIVKEEILDKVGTLDCLLFFGHAKGFSNFDTYPDIAEDLQRWIVGCYYLSLEYVDEMEDVIGPASRFQAISFGSFPVSAKEKIEESEAKDDNVFVSDIKYNWYFSGCFFWVNTMKLHTYINVFSPTIPKVQDRYFSERLLGNLYPRNKGGTGHNANYLYPCNFYNPGIVTSALGFILTPQEFKEFDTVYKEIIDNI